MSTTTTKTKSKFSERKKQKAQSLEKEINDFLELWGYDEMRPFLGDVGQLLELYDTTADDDWVEKAVGTDDVRNVRLVRTVYLMSRFIETHVPRMCYLKSQFPNLWKRLENTLDS